LEENNRKDYKEMEWNRVIWINVTRYSDQWHVLVNTAIILRVPKTVGNFFSTLGQICFSRKTLLQVVGWLKHSGVKSHANCFISARKKRRPEKQAHTAKWLSKIVFVLGLPVFQLAFNQLVLLASKSLRSFHCPYK
jgi:hypothetical protein